MEIADEYIKDNTLNRREFLVKYSAVAVAASIPDNILVPSGAVGKRPNIVLIMADDLGHECLGAYGNSNFKTPQIDKLSESGIRFEHCYSQPVCAPSRVQLLTGIYSIRNYHGHHVLPRNQVTFAQLLKKRGYATCAAGKWQLGQEKSSPQHFGFDESCLWNHTLPDSRHKYLNPKIDINGELVEFTNGEYGPDIVSDFACRFVERNSNRPFMLYYPMILPHWPFRPTPDSADWNSAGMESARMRPPNAGGKDQKYFGEMIEYMDKSVGNLIATLDQLGLRKNTLIVFTGDNGTMRSMASVVNDKIIEGGKRLMTDAGTHVPLICNWLHVIPGGITENDLVDFTDFLPTLADAGGADVPSGLNLDGKSFLPQLLGRAGKPRDWVYCYYKKNAWARNQRYKLYMDGNFYDVHNDVLEKNPLMSLTPETRPIHQMLQQVLDRFAKEYPSRFIS